MHSKKERSLAALYKGMTTEEIERRLALEDLAEVAREVAAKELLHRQAGVASGSPPALEAQAATVGRPARQFESFILNMALFSALAWMLLSKEAAMLLIICVSLPALAISIGKAAPVPAKIFGWIFLATPLWLGLIMWRSGDLAWQSGDYRPLWSLIMWIALGFMSLVGMAIGGSLITGARHQGTWQDLSDEIEEHKGTSKNLTAPPLVKLQHPEEQPAVAQPDETA